MKRKANCFAKAGSVNFIISRLIGLLTAFFMFSGFGFSQNQDLEIFVDWIEKMADNSYTARFGYINHTNQDISVKQNQSQLLFNGDKGKEWALYVFKPGLHVGEPGLPVKNFIGKDRVKWRVKYGNGTPLEAIAEQSSYVDEIASLYKRPAGGKVDVSELIGAELKGLSEMAAGGGTLTSNDVFQLNTVDGIQKVLIEIRPLNGVSIGLDDLPEGFEFVSNGISLVGWYPIAELGSLNDLIQIIAFVRPVYPPILNRIESQGDAAMKSDFVRGGYKIGSEGIWGQGIKVGVISDSYNKALSSNGGAAADIFNMDLPEDVEVILDYPKTASDEGRAMLQIVHDIAPGATLAFRTGFQSPKDFADGIRELAGRKNLLDTEGLIPVPCDIIDLKTCRVFRDVRYHHFCLWEGDIQEDQA